MRGVVATGGAAEDVLDELAGGAAGFGDGEPDGLDRGDWLAVGQQRGDDGLLVDGREVVGGGGGRPVVVLGL